MQFHPGFITFEGGDGSGKTTQIQMLHDYLETQNIFHLTTREPGGSSAAEEVRKILINGAQKKWDSISETLLFYAARRSHLTDTIWPAIKNGKLVISDRYADSTVAYQLYGYQNTNITKEQLDILYQMIAGHFKPDLTIILDIDPRVALSRVQKRGEKDRFESKGITFHERLREGFRKIASIDSNRCVLINANQSKEQIHQEVIRLIKDRFL